MPQVKVFVSSTYLDLLDARAAVGDFFTSHGFVPVLFERGGVYFNPSEHPDKACTHEIDEADLFVLILGGRYGTPVSGGAPPRSGIYNSIVKAEYERARNKGIPIYVFVRREVDTEFRTFLRNPPGKRDAVSYSQVDDVQVFKLLEQIHQARRGNPTIPFSTASELVELLKLQLLGMVGSALRRERKEASQEERLPVNAYKLFFFRMQKGLSFSGLQKASGIDRVRLRRLELVSSRSTTALDTRSFQKCSVSELEKLEGALECAGCLRAGQDDDFLSKYIHYFATYKGRAPSKSRTGAFDLGLFPVRAVVFDFDGTLTRRSDDLTTWERIWVELGYTVNDCAFHHREFSEGKISHKEWCSVTLDSFRQKGLVRQQLESIARRVELLDDAAEVLRELHSRGTRLYILSGSIRQVIKVVLGDLYDLFDEVKANEMTFDSQGLLRNIRGTKFDFAGKADFIRDVVDRSDLSPLEVLFVGNSCNDIFASRSGARTLCVNPHFTDPNILEHWTYCLRAVSSMREILTAIDQFTGFSPEGEDR